MPINNMSNAMLNEITIPIVFGLIKNAPMKK